jgi:hypothetical protein
MVSLGKCALKGIFIGVLATLFRSDVCSNNIHCSLSLSHFSSTRLATLSLCEDNHSVDLVLVDVVQSTLWQTINKRSGVLTFKLSFLLVLCSLFICSISSS